MKNIFIGILSAALPYVTIAQSRNNLFADVAINTTGFSVTYDRSASRHLDIGGGIIYRNYNYYTYANIISAGYLDIRALWGKRRSVFFALADAGFGIIGGKQTDSVTFSRYSFYSAVGAGYLYRINKRGMGPYLSLVLNGHTIHETLKNVLLTPAARDYGELDADLALSIGFKF